MLTLPVPSHSICSTLAGDHFRREGLIQKYNIPASKDPLYVALPTVRSLPAPWPKFEILSIYFR